MPPLARHSSHTSVLSARSTGSASSAPEADLMDALPARRRPTPDQLDALETRFGAHQYLGRQERIDLALAIGMELRAVTAWFQNRRQAAKRATGVRTTPHTAAPSARTPDADPGTGAARRGLRATASLDHFASRAERSERAGRPSRQRSFPLPAMLPAAPAPARPETPRRARHAAGGPSELWQLIPSSPAGPPSPAAGERLRSVATSDRERPLRSLEEACANAARRPVRNDSDTEDDEPTPPPSFYKASVLATPAAPDVRRAGRREKENTPSDVERSMVPVKNKEQDVEAAMMLIAFRTSPRG